MIETTEQECEECHGTGEIETQNADGEDEIEECAECDGKGYIEEEEESTEED